MGAYKTVNKIQNATFNKHILCNCSKYYINLFRRRHFLVKRSMNKDVKNLNYSDQIDMSSQKEMMQQSQVYWWHDKYRPRKPKYFNRVHTGYEWNKYNQTHYDSENPPPKVVLGYKFNIFYPDLIDKNKTPQYFVEKDTTN